MDLYLFLRFAIVCGSNILAYGSQVYFPLRFGAGFLDRCNKGDRKYGKD